MVDFFLVEGRKIGIASAPIELFDLVFVEMGVDENGVGEHFLIDGVFESHFYSCIYDWKNEIIILNLHNLS